MEFNKLIRAKFYLELQKYGFEISEELKNIVRFQSSSIEINIIFNDLEKSCYLSIGRKGEALLPLNDNVAKEFFNSKLAFEQVTPEAFLQNLSLLFETKEGIEILRGNIDPFIKYKQSEINNFNTALILKQALEAASKAWKAKDYISFVEIIDKIGINNISQSYQLKYKIAKQNF